MIFCNWKDDDDDDAKTGKKKAKHDDWMRREVNEGDVEKKGG